MPDEKRAPAHPAIRPHPRCVSVAPGYATPPEFQVAAGDATSVWLEVATDPALFASRPELRDPRDTRAGIFFDTREGVPALDVPPAGPVRVRTGSDDDHHPTTLAVPGKIWDAVRSRRDVTRLYYRVAGLTADYQLLGAPEGVEDERPLFIHVRHGSLAPLYAAAGDLPKLPRLAVKGRGVQQVDGKGPNPFPLHGLNVPMFYLKPWWGKQRLAGPGAIEPSRSWYESAALTDQLIETFAKNWKANVLRVTLNEDWILNGAKELPGEYRKLVNGKGVPPDPSALPASKYLEDIDRVVRVAGKAGLYVILCITAERIFEQIKSDRTYYAKPYLAPMPTGLTMLAWEILASRYKNASWVIFDLFNEPHPFEPKKPGDPDHEVNDIYRKDRRPYPNEARDLRRPEARRWWEVHWHDWARALSLVVRRSDGKRLLMVTGIGGPNWGASLRSLPPQRGTPIDNVVYAAHLYCIADEAGKTDSRWDERSKAASAGKAPAAQAADRDPLYWLTAGGGKQPAEVPIFITEWGPDEWPWAHAEDDEQAPACTQWKWKAGDQEARAKALLAALAPPAQTAAAKPGALPPLVGWAAWAVNGKPPLNCRRRIKIAAFNPSTNQETKIPVDILDVEPAPTPWGKLVFDELARLKPPRPA